MTSAQQSTAAKGSQPPPTDALKLPLPPVTLHFAVRGDAFRDGFYQRYLRKGDVNDATSAVIGKGGFGTAYRYVRDDSFTPPTSVLETTVNSADCDMSGGSDLSRRRSNLLGTTDLKGDTSMSRQLSGNNIRSSTVRGGSVPPSPTCGTAKNRQQHRNKAPAVVVVKVCRTPTSGSYDELPKTGVGRTEAKIAAQEILAGNPSGEHTRIVRGEARLLRYLQMCQSLEQIKPHKSHCVRLLADIPMSGMRGESDSDETSSGPPVPRLLVFERLVDLDAELTSRGWSKSRQVWSIEKVESTAKDAIAGLKFLHDHAIVHGDLKPSNFMRDARTGTVKLIDLGASRRWVRLHNLAKERTTAVEELDQAVQNGQIEMQRTEDILCEGLGSLTGSPHFMAPEVLLQAGRYLSADGMARNVLDDYMSNKNRLPRHPSTCLLSAAHRDFKRGWGIKADIWSWGCSVLSLMLRTIDPQSRPSSNTVCAFDFSFESDVDALPPLWPLHPSNDSLPRFHQWARLYALRIMSVVERGVAIPKYASSLSAPFLNMLQASFYHLDSRPSATMVLDYLDSHSCSNVEYMSEAELELPSRAPSRAHSVARSVASASSVGISMPDEPHNIDLTPSTSFMTTKSSLNSDIRLNASEQNVILPGHPQNARITLMQDHSNSVSRQSQNVLSSSPMMSPGANERSLSPFNSEGRQVVPIHRPIALKQEAKQPNSRRSSFSAEMANVARRAEDAISVSPSIHTNLTTPLMETLLPQTPKQPPGSSSNLNSPQLVREEDQRLRRPPLENRQRTESISSIQSNGFLMNDHRPGKQTLKGKVSRTSIFSRMASSFAPRLQMRTGSYSESRIPMQGGEQTARPLFGQNGMEEDEPGSRNASKYEVVNSASAIMPGENLVNRRTDALGLHLGNSEPRSLRPARSQASLNTASSNHRAKGSITNSVTDTRTSPASQYFPGDSGNFRMQQQFTSLQQQKQQNLQLHHRVNSVPKSMHLHTTDTNRSDVNPTVSSAMTMSAQQSGFLRQDPFPHSTINDHDGPRTAPLMDQNGDNRSTQSTRRQRSWSAFFRRNKKQG